MAKEKKSGFFSWFKKKETQEDLHSQSPLTTTPEEAYSEKNVEKTSCQPLVNNDSIDKHEINHRKDTDYPVEPTKNNLNDTATTTAIFDKVSVIPVEISQQNDTINEQVDPEDPIIALEITENVNDIVIKTVEPIDTVVETIVESIEETPEKKKEGFFRRLTKGLLKTKQNIGSGLKQLFKGRKIDSDLFDELEEHLLVADVGINTATKIIDTLTEQADKKQLKDSDALYELLKKELGHILSPVSQPLVITDHKPFIILMVGVNGVGKTTTIGKLARQFQQQGKSVMLAAGDTFRAAAIEQLQVWGERNQIPVIAQHSGSDAASVIFDAVQAAKARKVDVLIADTAGRLQNKSHLMNELSKIVRVMKKLDNDAPHEIMLTIDAGTGQNAISQVKTFNDVVGLTGITITKLDGTAKGGVIFGVADQFAIPIRYIGIGEKIEDLRTFNAPDFIDALFEQEDS